MEFMGYILTIIIQLYEVYVKCTYTPYHRNYYIVKIYTGSLVQYLIVIVGLVLKENSLTAIILSIPFL